MEGSGKQPMTESTRNELKELMEGNLSTFTRDADSMRMNIKVVLEIISKLEEKNRSLGQGFELERLNDLKRLLKLQEFVLLTQLIWLDIVCAFRLYLNATYEYEGIFSAKLLIVTVNEGSKKIFHFEKHRKNSFWGKDINEFMLNYSPSKSEEYNKINFQVAELDLLYKDFDWQNKRKTLVHYDDNPSEVYDLVSGLDIDLVTKKATPFIKVLHDMKVFCYDLSDDFFSTRI